MKIYIEGIIVLALFFIFFFGFMWKKWSERRLLKKYKPEDDKGRKGSELRSNETRKQGSRNSNINTNGLKQSKRREFLQKTEVSHDGETTTCDGENNKSNRKLGFIRRK